MPELTTTDVLVGRLALSQGKISRPQLDQAIATYRSGQAPSLAHAIVGARLITTDDMRAIVQAARTQEGSNGPSSSATGSVFGVPRPGGPASPFPPAQRPQGGYAPLPAADVSGMQSVRVRGGAAGPLPQAGTAAHQTLRVQYEEYVLARLLAARGYLPDAQAQDLLRRQKLELTASGRVDPLARVIIRAGIVSPSVVDQLCHEIQRKVVECGRCGDCNFVEPGPEPQQFACKRCQGPVSVPSIDGRMPFVDAGMGMAGFGTNPEAAEDAGEVTRPITPPGPGGFAMPGVGFGSSPQGGGFGQPEMANNQPTFAENPSTAGSKSDAPPEAVGEWAIEREIGRGGMGVIYLAKHKTRGEKAALKLMLNAPQASEKKQKRFTREVDAARKLNHPGIVRLLDTGEHEGFPFFAMEYVDGKPLDKLLKEELDLELGMEVLEKLCRGVHYAHEHGIVHRDLKPANVLVDDNMNPKLTDFGLAKSEDHKSVLTKTGAVVGTPYYLSPEQARGNSKDVDRRADIYALGVIMYELITGRLPFVGQTTVELYNRILNDDPPPPTRVKPQLTKEIETVCLKALEKNPRERYQTAEQLADDVKALLGAKPISARPPGWWKRFKRRLRKKGLGTLIAFGVVTLVALSGGGVAWYLYWAKTTAAKDEAQAEQNRIMKQLDGQAAIVSESLVTGEKALSLGHDREALKAAGEAVAAGELVEGALTLSKLEANKAWVEKLKTDRGAEVKRIHASGLILRARIYVAADDPQGVEKGQRDLDEAAKLEPDAPGLVCAQAENSVLAQHVNEAIERLKTASSYVPARLLEARIHRTIRDEPQEAMKSLNAALDLVGESASAAQPGALRDDWAHAKARILAEKALASMAYEAEEPPTRALPFADEAIKLAPDLWEAHAARARVLAGLGRRHEARDELRKVGETGRDLLPALLEQGEVYLLLRRLDDAREAAEQAVNTNPASLDAFVLRARVHDAAFEEKDARADADQAQTHAATGGKKFWAQGARARRLLARAVLMQGDPTEIKQRGAEHANAAKEFDPESAATRITYARVALNPAWGPQPPSLETVDKLLKEAAKRWPSSPEIKRTVAMAADVRNPGPQLTKAKDVVQKALKSDPGSAYSHALMARVDRAAIGPKDPEPEEANKDALRALELERDIRRDEGWYYAQGLRRIFRKGTGDEAVSALRRAVYADPLGAQALTALAAAVNEQNPQRAFDYFGLAAKANHMDAAGFEGAARWASRKMLSADFLASALEAIDRAERVQGGPTASTLAIRAGIEARQLQQQSRKPDPASAAAYVEKCSEIATLFSAACGMDPWNEQLIKDRYETVSSLAYDKQSAELHQLAYDMKKDCDDKRNQLRLKADDVIDSCRDAETRVRQGRASEAVAIATTATRKAPWVVEGWLALANARHAAGDHPGAVAALARGLGAGRADASGPTPGGDLRALTALGNLLLDLRGTKTQLAANTVSAAIAADDEAAPISTDTRTLVRVVTTAAACFLSGDTKSAAAKEASEASRALLAKRPEAFARVFARGLAALAAGEAEDALRELSFSAAVADDKGELTFLHALAAARAAKSVGSSDWRQAACADDALDALERATAATADLAKAAREDPDLKDYAAKMK